MTNWRPTASLENLKKRAEVLKKIRAFFTSRGLLEVETPVMCNTSVTDPYLTSFKTTLEYGSEIRDCYFQTSPEYAMKRLIAANYGDIFQITKAFRNGEKGHQHQPEFTMLEWYRMGFTHIDLMKETDELLQAILRCKPAEFFTYQTLFERAFSINPHTISLEALQKIAAEKLPLDNIESYDKDTLLQQLMAHYIEPDLGWDAPAFIYDFPASQAALAKINREVSPAVAERFEVYMHAMELANGFHELQNADEQRARFEANNRERQQKNLPTIPIDHFLLSALENGLPTCAGIALGVDRLVMLACNASNINEVIAFDINNA